MEIEGKLAEAVRKIIKLQSQQPINESYANAIPELDEKIRGLRAEITGKLHKISGFYNDKKETVGISFEDLRNEYDSLLYTYLDLESLIIERKVLNERSDADNSPKKKGGNAEQDLEKALSEVAELKSKLEDANLEYKKILNQIDEDNQNLLARNLKMEQALITKMDEITNLQKQAALRDAASYTCEEKLHVLGIQKNEADATIAKLTDELGRAQNQKLELEKRNEENQRIRMELQVELENTLKDLKSSKEEVVKLMDNKEFQETIVDRGREAKMASQVGQTFNETIKEMDTLCVKFEEELASLVEELEEGKDEIEVVEKSITRLNQSVKNGEEKIGELEKIIALKDEQMKEMETKISEKESTISSLSETLQSIITTATTKQGVKI